MSGWLDPVRAGARRPRRPCRVFFRDDDAGWDDERLWALLDLFDRAGVPVDLAVIPAELRPAADRGAGARGAAAGCVHVHQHGFAHVNHEPAGRKCEFGPARSAEPQAADIARGAGAARTPVGELVEPVFTPPWNRCTPRHRRRPAEPASRVLSRDVTRRPRRRARPRRGAGHRRLVRRAQGRADRTPTSWASGSAAAVRPAGRSA